MYLIVAFAVTIMVIALAWHGMGVAHRSEQDRVDEAARTPRRAPRPGRPQPRRVIAPDDDPEFLSEIDRKLRGGDAGPK